MGVLNKIFKSNRPDNLSKVDYWKKWEFFELLEDLHAAEKILAEYQGGYSGEFLSAEEFHEALLEATDDIEFGNQMDLSRFWLWFAPTCAWDDFVGEEGIELGNRIFERVDKWKKSQQLTWYIANRAFDGLRKFSAIFKHRQIVDLAFKMKKIKTKYNDLAQCKLESLSLSTALLAIY